MKNTAMLAACQLVALTEALTLHTLPARRLVAVRRESVFMADSEATRDSEPAVGKAVFGAGSGWKPPSGGGDAHGGAGFESTDTPDFFEDDEVSQKAKNFAFTDGMMGSQAGRAQSEDRAKNRGDPGVAGALDVNPDIYVPEAEDLSAESRGIVFELKKSGMTDLDYDIQVDSIEGGELKIDVRPVCMTFEEFYCGFTADSHPAFSVTPTEGKMERRNGPPTSVTVKVNPSGRAGTFEGWLCFILPEEKAFSTYYKITAESR